MHFVFMGVAGSGKSTVARRVAERLGLPFAEADDFHPPANIDKMAAGIALTDHDRWPWLRELAGWITEHDAHGDSTVMACSSLRRDYRDALRRGAPEVYFLHLSGSPEVIWERMETRKDHFMPPALLQSQFDTLEPLESGEPGLEMDVREDVETLLEQALEYVRSRLPEAKARSVVD